MKAIEVGNLHGLEKCSTGSYQLSVRSIIVKFRCATTWLSSGVGGWQLFGGCPLTCLVNGSYTDKSANSYIYIVSFSAIHMNSFAGQPGNSVI